MPARRPCRRLAGLAALALAGGLLAGAAPARADLAPDLAQLLQAVPEQPATVIVSLTAQVDPALYAGDPAGLVAAQKALAEQTQQGIADAAGVPVVSLWSINALTLTAPAETIERLAALPGVARVDVDPTVQIAPVVVAPTTAISAAAGQVQASTQVTQPPRPMTITVDAAPLRVLGVVPQRAGSRRSLLVRVALGRAATVRAELRIGTRRIAASSVRRTSAGRFAFVVAVPPHGGAPLRLRVTAGSSAGWLIGPAVVRAVSIAA
jgi:hypothetical protein